MSKNSQPQAPNYTEAAIQQGAQTQQLNAQQTYANRPNVNTPWGNLDYTQTLGTDPATGQAVTNWNENVGLNPQEQTALSNQQGIQSGETGVASNLLSGIDQQIQQQPGTAPQTQNMTGAGQGLDYNPASMNPQAEEAVWNQFQNMQEPLQEQQTQSLDASLGNQGLKVGDAAYDTATKNLMNTQYTQDQTAMDQAVGAGQSEAATLFNEGNAAQAQGFGQGATQTQYNNAQIPQNISNQEAELGLGQEKSGYDLNLMNGLMNGQQVSMPSFPGTTSAGQAQPAQLLQASELQGNAMLNAYNANAGANNSMDAGILGLLGTAAEAYASSGSDERLKSNKRRVGETDEGTPIYTYNFKGDPHTRMGVMAQELRKKRPDAVHKNPNLGGMYSVDYSKVA
jgi:hypothetical protein